MGKKFTLESQIQDSHLTLIDIQQKALEEYDNIKTNFSSTNIQDLQDQIEVSKMLDAKMKMVIDATGKQIELMKVRERAERPSEGSGADDSPKGAVKNVPMDEIMKNIRNEFSSETKQYD